MVGWMAIAMGLLWLFVVAVDVLDALRFFGISALYVGLFQLRHKIFTLPDLIAAFPLLIGGVGCLRLRRWGKVLLLSIACLHPIVRGIASSVDFPMPRSELVAYLYFFFPWLPFLAFPLMAFVLLLRRDIHGAFVSRDGVSRDTAYNTRERTTRPPLRAANRALCCLAILYGAILTLVLVHDLMRGFPRSWDFESITPVVLCAMLLAGSVGCLFFQHWARVLLLLFSLLWPLCFALPMLWRGIGSWSLREVLWILDVIMRPVPFTLVIFMFFLNRDVATLYSRRREAGAS